MEKRYQLRKNEYYLSAYYIREHEDEKITLSSFEVELFRKEDYEYED